MAAVSDEAVVSTEGPFWEAQVFIKTPVVLASEEIERHLLRNAGEEYLNQIWGVSTVLA